MNPIRLTAPFTDADTLSELTRLNAGDRVLISGTVFTARDAAHKKMIELLDGGGTLPFDPAGAVIYYVGPTPAPPGLVIGSAGPTTASRMDAYTPKLLSLGVKGVIGKGYCSEAVRKSLITLFSVIKMSREIHRILVRHQAGFLHETFIFHERLFENPFFEFCI